ncbi:Hsp70 family protein [Streptomyces acidicola]|uniref:Hsp70 family protein n=1 Tax=Streptomyces acidicola TaxID=2596892 RepID=UPI00344AB812
MTQVVSKAVGIDLGTTNSAVAVMDPADAQALIHRDPRTKAQTTPSCVWRGPRGGELVVGRRAFSRVGSTPEPITSVKRLMGTSAALSLAGEEMTPAQVSAAILAEMKRQIEEDVTRFDTPGSRWTVDRAVVTVPAYFDQPQIEATHEAARLAGLDVVDLLHEPTAAASYHCWHTGTRDGTFLVYDFGGGTFDVSVVKCTAGNFKVHGISGNNRLGGDDIDTALARHLQSILQQDDYALELDLEGDPEDRLRFRRLRMLAEQAKKALSDRTEYMLRDAGTLTDKEGRPVVIETLVERAELEEVARPFVERTFHYCDEAIARATGAAGITLAGPDHPGRRLHPSAAGAGDGDTGAVLPCCHRLRRRPPAAACQVPRAGVREGRHGRRSRRRRTGLGGWRPGGVRRGTHRTGVLPRHRHDLRRQHRDRWDRAGARHRRRPGRRIRPPARYRPGVRPHGGRRVLLHQGATAAGRREHPHLRRVRRRRGTTGDRGADGRP